MTYLIFDVEITGHHTEYIQYLMEFLVAKQEDGNKYYFVLNPDFKAKFPVIATLVAASPNIYIMEIPVEEFKFAKSGGLLRQSFRHYNLLKKYIVQLNADVTILLMINIFQIPLGFFRLRSKIRGILFSQFTRQALDKGLGEKIRYVRRYLQTWLFVKNSSLESVFLLNDQDSCNYLNSTFATKIFKQLPDPVPQIVSDSKIDIRKEFDIDPKRKIFLHFGSLSDRKGTFEAVQALAFLSKEVQEETTLILCGKVDTIKTKTVIEDLIADLKTKGIMCQVIFREGFCSNELKNSLFQQSDVILIPYKNVEASSGIFGHAISVNKPVIGPSAGLLGKLIVDNGLGLVIDAVTPRNLALAMSEDLSTLQKQQYEEYCKRHTPKIFASTLVSDKIDN